MSTSESSPTCVSIDELDAQQLSRSGPHNYDDFKLDGERLRRIRQAMDKRDSDPRELVRWKLQVMRLCRSVSDVQTQADNHVGGEHDVNE